MASTQELIDNITSISSPVYTLLRGPHAIRLLGLGIGKGEEPLSCNVALVEEVNDDVGFHALSY